jgi:hypothetical protein
MQLAVPGIDANDLSGAARQQNMGEAPRRGANIETNAPSGIEAEGIERGGKLDATARDPRIGLRGLDMRTGHERRGRLADDFAVGPHEPGGDGFLRLGSARKELAANKRDIGAPVRSGFLFHASITPVSGSMEFVSFCESFVPAAGLSAFGLLGRDRFAAACIPDLLSHWRH